MAKERCFNIMVIFLAVVILTLRHAKACGGLNDIAVRNKTTFVMVGSLAELSCFVSNVDLAAWVLSQENSPTYVSLGKNILGRFQGKYAMNVSTDTNEESIHVNSSMYSLIINKATEDMGGIYTCKHEGCDIMNVILFVEVPPLLWLQADYSNISSTSINVTQNKEFGITCKAVGGRPEVSLSWKVNGQNQTHGVTTETIPNGVSSILQYRPSLNDKNVTCETSGQITAPFLETFVYINVFYPPTCHILLLKESLYHNRVSCVCAANPQVSRWSIFVNNDPSIESNTILLPVELVADIYCRADNAVGSYKTPSTKYYPKDTSIVTMETAIQPTSEKQNTPSYTMIIIAFSVATLVAAAVVIFALVFCKRMTTSPNSRNENDGTDNSMQHYYYIPAETRGVRADSDVKYATYVHQEPNHEFLGERTNVPLDAKRKPEYLDIKD